MGSSRIGTRRGEASAQAIVIRCCWLAESDEAGRRRSSEPEQWDEFDSDTPDRRRPDLSMNASPSDGRSTLQ